MAFILTQSRYQDAQVSEEPRTEDPLQPLTMIKVESEGHLRPSYQQGNHLQPLGNKYIGEFNLHRNIDQNINIIF